MSFNQSSFNQFSALALQGIAQRLLDLDVEAKNKLHQFNHKIIHIQVTDLDLDYYFCFAEGQLSIVDRLVIEPETIKPETAPETVKAPTVKPEAIEQNSNQPSPTINAAISGKLNAFIAAAAAEHSADSIFRGELHFTGEINTAKQFQQFAQSLNIDWQEPIAKTFGDPVAHILTSGLKSLSGWVLKTAHSISLDVSEYLQEEAKATPSNNEQQHFFQQVSQLRSRTDRLNARFNQLLVKQASSDRSDDRSGGQSETISQTYINQT